MFIIRKFLIATHFSILFLRFVWHNNSVIFRNFLFTDFEIYIFVYIMKKIITKSGSEKISPNDMLISLGSPHLETSWYKCILRLLNIANTLEQDVKIKTKKNLTFFSVIFFIFKVMILLKKVYKFSVLKLLIF